MKTCTHTEGVLYEETVNKETMINLKVCSCADCGWLLKVMMCVCACVSTAVCLTLTQ